MIVEDGSYTISGNSIDGWKRVRGMSVSVGVGYFADGWHDDGTSQAFKDKYDSLLNEGHDLGDPWDNGGTAFVHAFYGMLIQDFSGPDNGFDHEYTALIRGPNPADPVCLLRDGFWLHYMYNAGWLSYGHPVNDEYQWDEGDGLPWTRQNFVESDGTARYLLWREGTEIIPKGTLTDELLYLFGVVFNWFSGSSPEPVTHLSAGDGIYHLGQFVADFGSPISLLENQSYSGLYALVGGQQIDIDQFTVTSDMVITVGEETAPDPCEVGHLQIRSHNLHVSGDYAYLLSHIGSDEMMVVDVADPTDPVLVGTVSIPDGEYHIFVEGDYAYVTSREGGGLPPQAGLYTVDISDPTNPTVVHVARDTDHPFKVIIEDGYAYVMEGTMGEGLHIYDASNPPGASLLTHTPTPSNVGGLDVEGNYA